MERRKLMAIHDYRFNPFENTFDIKKIFDETPRDSQQQPLYHPAGGSAPEDISHHVAGKVPEWNPPDGSIGRTGPGAVLAGLPYNGTWYRGVEHGT
jgi:hypothetical protein